MNQVKNLQGHIQKPFELKIASQELENRVNKFNKIIKEKQIEIEIKNSIRKIREY